MSVYDPPRGNGRRFAVGDIHGNLAALEDVLEQVNFDFEIDRLVVLGDVYDGYRGRFAECVELLLKVKRLVWIRGNHDAWVLKWFTNTLRGHEEYAWLNQGGYETRSDYLVEGGYRNHELIERHCKELALTKLYFIDADNNLFVHGGIDWRYGVHTQKDIPEIFYWDRATYDNAKQIAVKTANYDDARTRKYLIKREQCGKPTPGVGYRAVFIGHTATKYKEPKQYLNIWNIDQGAGGNGRLTLMNTDTFEYWQSAAKEERGKIIFVEETR